jgi:hypothetical protein
MPQPSSAAALAAAFVRRLAGSVPSCPHLQFREPPMFLRAEQSGNRAKPPPLNSTVRRLRSLHFGSRHDARVSVHAAYRVGLDVCREAYLDASRPCRSDLIARLAAGLVSVARSGAVPGELLADALLPVFDRWVDPRSIDDTLAALLSACEALPPFANPGLGAALCTALASQLVELEGLCDDTLADILRPCLFTVMVVTTGSLYDFGAGSVLADAIPFAKQQVTTSRSGIFRLTSTFVQTLRSTLYLPQQRLDIELPGDMINALAALLLVDSPAGHRVVHPVALSIDAQTHLATLSLPTCRLVLKAADLADLQHLMQAHLLDLPWRAWSDLRALHWGDR